MFKIAGEDVRRGASYAATLKIRMNTARFIRARRYSWRGSHPQQPNRFAPEVFAQQ